MKNEGFILIPIMINIVLDYLIFSMNDTNEDNDSTLYSNQVALEIIGFAIKKGNVLVKVLYMINIIFVFLIVIINLI